MHVMRVDWLVGLLAVMLAVGGCAEDGLDGAPGVDGAPGERGSPGGMGIPGENGDDGRDGLVAQSDVEPGAECTFGGVRIDSGTDDDRDGTLDEAEIDQTSFVCNAEAAFTLQLLHFADVDSSESTALGAVDEFSGLVDGFQNDPVYGPQTIVVSSGDNVIPGPRWFSAENNAVRALTGSNEPGHVDHFFLNACGVAASAIGNHELAQGPGEFSDALQVETRGDVTFPGTLFPYLAANIDFSGDRDLDARAGVDGRDFRVMGGQVAGSTVVRIGGQRVGLVGASTPQLASITTTGALTVAGSTTTITELADAIQPTIDALVTDGIDKIIVLAHMQQIAVERALAEVLTDVDIIVAGGSNTRMGDSTDVLFPGDDAFSEAYPFGTTDADRLPTLIVNVEGDYNVSPLDVSEGHLRGTLRFDNGSKIFDVTCMELEMLLEHGVAATARGATPGQFPQVGGIAFGLDPAGTAQVLTVDADDNVTGIATPGGRITDLYIDTDGTSSSTPRSSSMAWRSPRRAPPPSWSP
jgi:hypothetical protein